MIVTVAISCQGYSYWCYA